MAKEVILSGPGVIKLVAHYMSEEHVAIWVQKALDYATEAHKDQFRKSGEPYIHPSYSSSRDFSGTTNGILRDSRHWFFT